MALFTIIINDFTGIGICKGVVIEAADNLYDTFAKLAEKKMSNTDSLEFLYSNGWNYAVAKDLLHNVFMIELDKLVMGEENYHRNAAAKKILTAKAVEVNSIKALSEAQYDENHMLIDLTLAQESGDVSDIVVISRDKDVAAV